MSYSAESEIHELVKAFEACTLPRQYWSHAAHLTIALWYWVTDSANAVNRIRTGIQRYNQAHGIGSTPTSGYHETITLFWSCIVRRFLTIVDGDQSLLNLVNQLIDHYSDSKLLFQYYSSARLFSPEARLMWVEPDLQTDDDESFTNC